MIPPEAIIANTATKWAWVYWTMVIWQAISANPVWRSEFLAHEAFHRIQAEIGLPMPEVPNANVHLDTLEGSYWLQLEWRARCTLAKTRPTSSTESTAGSFVSRAGRTNSSVAHCRCRVIGRDHVDLYKVTFDQSHRTT